ncbi:MAG TPA: DUF5658 family protein [Methanothrix sp.]|nr:DUF5658 family protein [Methanothrix sp.]HOL44529.1 DUF5658 family protein [Methanothrix sp.]
MDKYIIFFFVLVVLLQIMDVISTNRALSRGAKEANKIIACLMDKIGIIPALVLVKILFLAILLIAALFLEASLLIPIYTLIIISYSLVVIHNIRSVT